MNVLAYLKQRFIELWYDLAPIDRLRRSGAKIGKNVFIGRHTYVELENAALLSIEDEVTISSHIKIIFHDSSLNNTQGLPVKYGQVVLRKNCYIGINTLILPGTEVGANTIVGANSLVKGKLKSNSVYLGQPARWYCSIAALRKKWQQDKNPLTFLKDQPKWHQAQK